jgi:hypothetical protein
MTEPTDKQTAFGSFVMYWWSKLDTRQKETWLLEAGGDLTTKTPIDAWWAYRTHYNIPFLECEWMPAENQCTIDGAST